MVLASVASALAVVGVAAGTTPEANALSGRRLCMYVEGDYNNGVWRFIVLNYKKDGRCPYVNQKKYPHLVAANPHDVPKRICEEISAHVGYADDICRVLEADRLYELLFDQQTFRLQRNLLGHVNEFG